MIRVTKRESNEERGQFPSLNRLFLSQFWSDEAPE